MHVPILATKLIEAGHQVLAVLHPKGQILAETALRGIPSRLLRIGAYVNPLTTARLWHLLNGYRPDIVHLHLSRDLWQVAPAARWGPSPGIVLTKHVGSYVTKRDPLHRWLYRHIDRVITVSEILNRNVCATCPVAPEKVITIHHALDMDKYAPDRCDRASTRRDLEISDDTLVIGSVGRLSPGKGYEDFLYAARKVLDQRPGRDIRFLIVGTASYGEEKYFETIRKLVHTLGLQDSVVFTGFRTDIPALLHAMDIFVFPSHAEGLGATLIEAMAMGVASVSTLSDGTLDILTDGDTGLAFAPGDSTGLAQVTLRLIHDSALRTRLGLAGQRRARQEFDLKVMVARVERVYLEIVEGRYRASMAAGVSRERTV